MTDMLKAMTRTEGGKQFPASAYAYVPDSTKPSTWKLKLYDTPADVPSRPSIRLTAAAAQALGPSGFRGNKVQLPSSAVAGVKQRVAAAWLKARRMAGQDVSREDLPTALRKSLLEEVTPTSKTVELSLSEGAIDVLNRLEDLAKTVDELKKLYLNTNTAEGGDPGAATEMSKVEGFCVRRILKQESQEQRTVLGVVLEPETFDSQNDIYSEEEIQKTAFRFMEHYQQFGLMHEQIVRTVRPLESYLAPVDFEIEEQKVKKGTWLMRVRVVDPDLWAAVKSGKLTGFSIGGSAIRKPVESGVSGV